MAIFARQARQVRAALWGALLAGLPMLSPAQASDVTLRMHYFLPPQSAIPARVLDVWAKRVEEQSQGRIAVQQFPSMQLGGRPPELIDQVIDGVADIIWTLPGYTPGRFPRSEVFELPFMMTTSEATSRALWELAEAEMLQTEFSDVKVLALFVHGPGSIHSKVPVETVDDLRGLKVRAPSRVTNMMIADLGATAVGMPVPAVAESLSKGVIDAAILPWEVTTAVRSSELVGHHTEFPGAPLYTATMVMAMNKQSYERLPDDLKAVIDANSGAEFSAYAGRQAEEANAPGRAIAVERGNAIVSLTPEQIEGWKAAAAPTVEAWVAEMEARGLNGAALLEDARAAIARHSAP